MATEATPSAGAERFKHYDIRLNELRAFTSASVDAKVLTPNLRAIMEDMRKFGVPIYEWADLEPLVTHMLTQSYGEFKVENEVDVADELDRQFAGILESLKAFQAAPFTIQRICELILEPSHYYRDARKLLYGLEKLVSVSSTLDIASREDLDNLSGEMRLVQNAVESFPNKQESDVEMTDVSGDMKN